jgi:hypothetical protein
LTVGVLLTLVGLNQRIQLPKQFKDDRFKKKFSDKIKKPLREAEPEEKEKRDPRGPRCFECLGFGHIRADCGNLKKGKGKAYNVTLSDESEEEAPKSEIFLAFVAPHVEEEDSYYSSIVKMRKSSNRPTRHPTKSLRR